MAKGAKFENDNCKVQHGVDYEESGINSEGEMDLDEEFCSMSLSDKGENESHDIESGINVTDSCRSTEQFAYNSNSTPVAESHSLPAEVDQMYTQSTRCLSDEGYGSVREQVSPVFINFKQTSNIQFEDAFIQDADGDTALHNGIIQGCVSIVLQIISTVKNSSFLNLRNSLNQTPLHLAVITRKKDIVRRLMVAGATVDARDVNGNTPLHIACREGYTEIVETLLHPVSFEETRGLNYDVPFQRIPQDLNQKNYDGLTCLHLAAQSTFLKIMDHLISRKADINAGDGRSGRTVLHYGAETGNRVLVEYLVKQRHLDICAQTYGGLTPLRLACGRYFPDIVGVLISHGADGDSDFYEEDRGKSYFTGILRF